MTVTAIRAWRLPGCGAACYPRNHDPSAHEAYGRILEREAALGRIVRTGPLAIDLDTRQVTVNGAEIVLSQILERYLTYLAERLGQWCHSDDVMTAVWGIPAGQRIRVLGADGRYRYAENSMVTSARTRLRRKLGAAGQLVETVRHSHTDIRVRLVREEPT